MPTMPITTGGPTGRRGCRRPPDTASPALDVDGQHQASVSSGPTDETATASSPPWSVSAARSGQEGHALVAVGPGLAAPLLRLGSFAMWPMNPLPVQAGKVQAPLVRADTLSRSRLNGWLDRAARARVALVIAEAGFGKTTFLGDWSSQSPRRTSWYRLEPDDRDWLTLIRHLVAGGRVVDEGFAPETYRLLSSLGPGGPTQADLIASLASEMAAFGAADNRGFSVILDDYHSIEASEETDPVIAALLEATGPGFSLIIAARTTPELPPVRLRGRTAVQRLDGDALRFDVPETDALFRDAYGIPLEPDVVRDLVARTEGWAALLSLVRTRLEERPDPDPRALVAQLSATDGDLYDFLAEEVLAEAPYELAEFLIHASALDDISEASAASATRTGERALGHIRVAEALGVLSGIPGSTRFRFAPLVREFLYAQLEKRRGRDYVRILHESVAEQFDGVDWLVAGRQYVMAGRPDDAVRVVAASVEDVLGGGNYRAALDLLADAADGGAVAAVLRSRSLLQIGASREALSAAEDAVQRATSNERDRLLTSLRNAATVAIGVHDYDAAARYSAMALEASTDPSDRRLAEAQVDLLEIAREGSLPALALRLEHLMARQQRDGHEHYEAISALNLAQVYIWLGRPEDALRLAARSAELLSRSSGGYERVSVTLVRSHANALLGRWHEAESLMNAALAVEHPEGHAEAVLEAAWIASWFGVPGLDRQIIGRIHRESISGDWGKHWQIVDLWAAQSDEEASRLLSEIGEHPTRSGEAGAAFRWQLTRARAYAALGDKALAARTLAEARRIAAAQGSALARRLAELLGSLLDTASSQSAVIMTVREDEHPLLGVFAREVVSVLGDLSAEAVDVVGRSVRSNPDRWRHFLRQPLHGPSGLQADRAASLLEEVGLAVDVELLRDYGRKGRRSAARWGDALTRRLAPRLWVDDLGLVDLRIGDRYIDGRSVRRKALALLTYLLTQPHGAATPDQLIEALWPDMDPDAALNSVHQTIYVLRRVIDHLYRAGQSPEYVHFESDMIWLDADLVDSRSWKCQAQLSGREWPVERIHAVLATYQAPFAGDFAYEEWASAYRDRLHALYLGLVEQAVAGKIGPSDLRWRLWVGQQVLLVDPSADAVEAQVIGLYRAIDATTAAREQYAHYAAAMREQLGLEPPQLDEL
jgi:LuxR family transcriptional regulator, maltose regulon positive regulatory protein